MHHISQSLDWLVAGCSMPAMDYLQLRPGIILADAVFGSLGNRFHSTRLLFFIYTIFSSREIVRKSTANLLAAIGYMPTEPRKSGCQALLL